MSPKRSRGLFGALAISLNTWIWYVPFMREFLLNKKTLKFGQNIFQPVIGQYPHKKRLSLLMVLSGNYVITASIRYNFAVLFLLSFRKLQRRIEKIRTSYIDCKADRYQRPALQRRWNAVTHPASTPSVCSRAVPTLCSPLAENRSWKMRSSHT